MVTLGLDNATKKLGYSVMQDGKLSEYGVMEEIDDNVIQRMNNLYFRIEQLIEKHKVDYIIIEDTFFSANIDTLKVLCQLQGCIMGLCFKYNIGLRIYQPSKWRKAIGIKGRKRVEQKASAIEYVNAKYGFTLRKSDDDIAEAIAINEAYYIITD